MSILIHPSSVRDATEPQNLVTFLKFNEEYDFEYKNDKFLPYFKWYDHIWKEPIKKVVNLHSVILP